jgi:hypothetical protein
MYYNNQAMVPMLFAISKHVRGRPIWLEDVVPAPKWSTHQDALCFHSATDAQITLKFLPGAERRGAAVVRWPGGSGPELGAKLNDRPLDSEIRTIADIRVVQDAASESHAPIEIPPAELVLRLVDKYLCQDAGEQVR